MTEHARVELAASSPRSRKRCAMKAQAPSDKRTRLVDTAARLVHEQGFNRTSLADIARESGVPLGNVYYYFKTKDAICEALIEKRSAAHAALRATWDEQLDPRAR